MLQIRIGVVGVVAVCSALLSSTVAAAGSSETLLPNTTQAYFSIPNTDKLSEQFQKTQLGQLAKDPVMKSFVEDLRRQVQERFSSTRERLGLTMDDLKGVPNGEVAGALIEPAKGEEAVALLVDVTGHEQQAQALLQKVTASLTKLGALQSQQQITGGTVTVFLLPRPEGRPVDAPQRQAMFVLHKNMLVASDNLEVLKGIVGRLNGQGQAGGTLADIPSYQAVVKRLKADEGSTTPQLRWFIQPLGYMEVLQAARPESKRRRGRTILDAFKATGFATIQGVGGSVDFSVDGFEILYRSAIFAPPPHEKSMQMLKFPNGADLKPQAWVPAEVAGYTSLYVDVLNAFDNIGPLFDELYNEGKPGLWEDVLKGLRTDPNGPRIDLRKELVAHLGNRVSMVTDYQLPITTTSERLLFAIETTDEKAAAAGLAKFFGNDPEIRKRTDLEGYVIWESVPEEKAPAVPTVSLELPGFGSDAKAVPQPSGRQASLLPNQALTVAHGHLFIASHYDFLVKVLKQAKANQPRESLARTVEYQQVAKAMAKFNAKEQAAENFAKTDEQYRPAYELIKQGKMPQSETMLGRVLNTVFGAGKKGVLRKQEIEGSKMPEYDVVRRYLGPGGLEAVTEPQGWFIKGFLLPKG